MKVKRSVKITNNRLDIYIRHSSHNNRYTEYLYKEGKLYTNFNHRQTNCASTKFYSQKWN